MRFTYNEEGYIVPQVNEDMPPVRPNPATSSLILPSTSNLDEPPTDEDETL